MYLTSYYSFCNVHLFHLNLLFNTSLCHVSASRCVLLNGGGMGVECVCIRVHCWEKLFPFFAEGQGFPGRPF